MTTATRQGLAALGICMAATFWMNTASADDPQRAEALFVEARGKMNDGDYASACPKLAESQRLDPTVGTVLNLALCYKHLGKTASAWTAYREAEVAAERASQPRRQDLARAEADALEPELHRVSITLTEPPDGLVVTIDGKPVPADKLATALPVDPGQHVVEARASGYETARRSFTSEVGTTALSIPQLVATEPQPVTPQPGKQASSSASPVLPATEPDQAPTLTGLRIGALAVGVVGLGGLVVGGVFATIRSSRLSDAEPVCSQREVCSPRGVELHDDAATAGTVSVIGFAAGGAALVGATTMWLLGGGGSGDEVATSPVFVSPSGAGVRLRW